MTCNMYDGVTSGDFAQHTANNALRRMDLLTCRVAELEQALCGLCQMLERAGLPPQLTDKHKQLQKWFNDHRKLPGCDPIDADKRIHL